VNAADPVVNRIAAFLEGIGLPVRFCAIEESMIVPGILLDKGVIAVDESKLKFPGDLLHEAAHLAVMSRDRRAQTYRDAGNDPAEEMAAIAWSYAAALHLDLHPSVVFHEAGYKGGSQALIDNFGAGRYVGVPILQWLGMAEDARASAASGRLPYPAMLNWVSMR
jgi:hypothetical protein